MRRSFTKAILLLTIVLPIFFSASLPSCADTNADMSDFWDIVPEEIMDTLPDGIEKSGQDELSRAFDGDYIILLFSSLVSGGLPESVSIFLELVSIIVLSAVSNGLSPKQRGMFDHIVSISASLLIYSQLYRLFEMTIDFVTSVNAFMTSFTGVMAAMYLSGGNTLASASHLGWLTSIVTLGGGIVTSLIVPALEIGMAMFLVSGICRTADIGSLVSFPQKITTGLLVFVMTLLSVVMSFQTSISAASDSISVRGVKFAAAQTIPVIGGMLGESIRVLSTSVSLIRTSAGSIAAIVVIIMSLSPLVLLFLTKLLLSPAKAISEMLGCDELSGLIGRAESMIGNMMAIIAIFDTAYIYCLSIFAKSVCAIS